MFEKMLVINRAWQFAKLQKLVITFENVLSLIKNPSHINNPPFKEKFGGPGAPPRRKCSVILRAEINFLEGRKNGTY